MSSFTPEAFKKASIKNKLVLILMLTSGVVLLAAVVLFSIIAAINYRQAEKDAISAVADVTARNIAAALMFSDQEAARETLSGLAAEPQIFAAAVLNKDLKILSYYESAGGGLRRAEEIKTRYRAAALPRDTLDMIMLEAARNSDWDLDIEAVRPITYNREEIGWIIMHSDLVSFIGKIRHLLITVAIIFSGSMLLAFFISRRLQKYITYPIISLTETIGNLSGSTDYSVRVKKHHPDEIGALTDSFNDMLEHVCSRDAQLMRKQEQLQESERKFREISLQFSSLLDALPDNIFLISPDLKMLWANRAAVASSGRSLEELVGSHCYLLWHGTGMPCEPCPASRSFRTGRPEMDIISAKKGQMVELRTMPIIEDGKVTNVIKIARDITEMKKLEKQLLHSQKMETVGTLAGGIAHDFNNILSTIIGYGNIALMQLPEKDDGRRYIESILESADRAAYLTRGLLSFSRKQITDKKHIDLNSIVSRMDKFLNRIIGEDITFRSALSEAELPVFADLNQIEQILMNLATNARDAMPEGGTFIIRTGSVMANASFAELHGLNSPGAYALIEASDTGIGMDEETRQKIFEPFFTTKEVGKGTGLGMSIIYGIVKEHEGHIEVKSTSGEGTTFGVYLPVHTGPVRGDRDAVTAPAATRGSETILFAEDDAELRNLLRNLLEDNGYAVITAVNGREAVLKFREHEKKIGLLLFDIIMPVMSGTDAYNQIREFTPALPILFTSGYSPDVVQKKIPGAKLENVIFKPVAPKELLQRIRTVLDLQKQPQV